MLYKSIYTVSITIFASACGTPSFDLPRENGVPTISSITKRIQCELVDMVRDDGPFNHRETLLVGNYQVAATLSLIVTDTGELAPNFNFPQTSRFLFNAGFKLSKSRKQGFTENFYYSMRQLRAQWQSNHNFGKCPVADTNLAGDLGIKSTVALALTGAGRDIGGKDEFGGSVEFTVEKNLNSVGPTWTLTHFKGPGDMGSLSRENVDTLTFAFVAGDGKTAAVTEVRASDRAKEFLNQLLISQIGFNRGR